MPFYATVSWNLCYFMVIFLKFHAIHLLDIRGLVFAMEPGHELGVKNFLQTLCLLQWLRVRSRVDRIKQ